MMNKRTGTILRELRKKSKLSVQDVLKKLKELGEEIQQPTLYAYENNTRAASADMLLALCQIYDCNNILETFANVEPDYSVPDDEEWKLIEKYRKLDNHGKEVVSSVLNMEFKRIQASNENLDSKMQHDTDSETTEEGLRKLIELTTGESPVILNEAEAKAVMSDENYAAAVEFVRDFRLEKFEELRQQIKDIEGETKNSPIKKTTPNRNELD